MSTRQSTLFDAQRMNWSEALELTANSLAGWGERYQHWAIAFSGGKDSTAVVSAVVWLIESGRVKAPKSLTILYADTRMEIPPLHATAMAVLDNLKARGMRVQICLPPLDRRFFTYMFGRGVPPPGANFRWCTGMLKIEPMQSALRALRDEIGEKFLVLTGVRLGESAARDARIALSCGKNGAECGQGWFQETTPECVADTLAPLLHWRVCFVWDWLYFHAPQMTGLPTQVVADVYGAGSGDLAEAVEANLRTGCVGCPVASHDRVMEGVISRPGGERFVPLMELRSLYEELRKPAHRIRKDGTERTKDGELVRNPCRMGPLTMQARLMGLKKVKDIQARAGVDLINAEEEARILELIEANTWPDKWTGEEPSAALPYEKVFADGSVQPIMEALMR